MTKTLLVLAILCFLVSTAGCASVLFGSQPPGTFDIPSLLIELNATIELVENATLPPMATPTQLAAFAAIQSARRAFILILIQQIEDTNPDIDLSRYRAAVSTWAPTDGA